MIDVDDGDERLDLKRSSEIGLARADNRICISKQIFCVVPSICDSEARSALEIAEDILCNSYIGCGGFGKESTA